MHKVLQVCHQRLNPHELCVCFLLCACVLGSILILEEAAYIDSALISEVVVPMLSVQNTVLLCISTLLEASNSYSKFFQMKLPSGEPVFEQSQVQLVCDACKLTKHPEMCTHMTHLLPRWLSSSKMETVRALLEDDPAMMMRESMGVAADDSAQAFSSDDITRFVKRQPVFVGDNFCYREGSTYEWITAIDPAGGGAGSRFSVVHIAQSPLGMVVVSALYNSHPCTLNSSKRSALNIAHKVPMLCKNNAVPCKLCEIHAGENMGKQTLFTKRAACLSSSVVQWPSKKDSKRSSYM